MSEERIVQVLSKDVAEWMVIQIRRDGVLGQPAAAMTIQMLFGDDFVYRDTHGYLAISRKVLYQFRKLTIDFVVWEVRDGNWFDGLWRLREFDDTPCRRQSVESR